MNFARMRSLMDRLPSARRHVEIELSRATKCTQQLTGMPSGGGGGNSGDSFIRYIEAKDALSALLQELQSLRDEAEPLIDALPDSIQRTVMKLRYIDGYEAHKIAVELHYSEGHIFRLLRMAEAEIG